MPTHNHALQENDRLQDRSDRGRRVRTLTSSYQVYVMTYSLVLPEMERVDG